MNNKGFTLLETLLVVAIIAILALAAMPIYKGYAQAARQVVHNANAKTLQTVAQLYLLDGGGDTTWAPEDGATPGERISGPHEAWYDYLDHWPEDPLGGIFVVEIEGEDITVWTRAGE